MRTHPARYAALAVVASALLVAAVAYAAPRLTSTDTNHIELTGCDGGITTSVPAGDYLVAVKAAESVTVCIGDAGCLTGGQYLPKDMPPQRFTFGTSTFIGANTPDVLSCNSPTKDGGLSLTLLAPGN